MDSDHKEPETKEVVTDYLQKLTDNDYDHNTRMEIVKSTTKKYFGQVMDQESGGRRLQRSASGMSKERTLKAFLTKNWYKSRRGGKNAMAAKDDPQIQREADARVRKEAKEKTQKKVREGQSMGSTEGGEKEGGNINIKEVETVVFIPVTPDSALRNLLQEKDEVSCKTANSPVIRFVERGGPTVLDVVGRKNPWVMPKEGLCTLSWQRANSTGGSIPSCISEGVNYTIECWTCRKEGVRRIYHGKTSRSPSKRGVEHLR